MGLPQLLLAGIVLFAVPGFDDQGSASRSPYPLLPLLPFSQIAGGALILYSARRLASGAGHHSQIVSSLTAGSLLVLFLLVTISVYAHPASTSQSTFEQIFGQFPLLSRFSR